MGYNKHHTVLYKYLKLTNHTSTYHTYVFIMETQSLWIYAPKDVSCMMLVLMESKHER